MATFTKQIKLSMSEDQYQRLQKIANEKNESMASVIRDVLEGFLERYPNAVGSKRKKLRDYEFYGMWKDRKDMLDSSVWVRELREKWSERNSKNETY
jgi:hypothetical protein